MELNRKYLTKKQNKTMIEIYLETIHAGKRS